MDNIDLIKQAILYFDKIDKLLVFSGVVFIFIGADFKIDWKSLVINFDKRQIIYFRLIGVVLVILSLLPALLSYWFRPVSLKDLVDLKTIIDDTQGMTGRGVWNPNRADGDNRFHAVKEIRYANESNAKAQTKITDMIDSLRH